MDIMPLLDQIYGRLSFTWIPKANPEDMDTRRLDRDTSNSHIRDPVVGFMDGKHCEN